MNDSEINDLASQTKFGIIKMQKSRMKLFTAGISIFLLWADQSIWGQRCDTVTFQSGYWIEGLRPEYLTKLIALPNGNLLIISSITDTGSYVVDIGDVNVTRITQKGTVLWSKRIGYGGSSEQPRHAAETDDGGFIICGATQRNNPNSDPWLARLDANGELKWSITLSPRGTASSGSANHIIQLNNGGFAVVGEIVLGADNSGYVSSGAFIATIDKDGKIVWAKTFQTSRDLNYFITVKELKDENLIVFGGGHKNSSSPGPYDGIGFIAKLDRDSGKVIWSTAMDEDYSAFINEQTNNNIRLAVRNRIYDFDANGTNIRATSLELPSNYLSGKDILHLAGPGLGEDYYFIKQVPNPVLLKTINDSAVEWAHSYGLQSQPGRMIQADDAIEANNAFYLGTSVNTNFFPDPSYKTSDLPYVIKTDGRGRTSCSDNFPMPFTFVKLAPLPNQSIVLNEKVSLVASTASMYAIPVLPHGVVDCSDITCCQDTVMYKKISICSDDQYLLPDGTIADKDGIYPTILKRASGCDSVILTTLSTLTNIKVSLGNDTCITDSRITFKLSYPGQVQYLWQDGNTDSIYTVSQPGQYWVRATTNCNISADSVIVYKDCNFPVYIPNAFTPDNDGLNDIFRISNLSGQALINFGVYNRQGQLVYFGVDPTAGWNGKLNGILQPSGVYVYFVRYKDWAGIQHEKKGTVVLIR